MQVYWLFFKQISLKIPLLKIVFPSKGANTSRVLFKSVSLLCYGLRKPNFWKLCSFTQKYLRFLSCKRKVIIDTFRESAVSNKVFFWCHSFESWVVVRKLPQKISQGHFLVYLAHSSNFVLIFIQIHQSQIQHRTAILLLREEAQRFASVFSTFCLNFWGELKESLSTFCTDLSTFRWQALLQLMLQLGVELNMCVKSSCCLHRWWDNRAIRYSGASKTPEHRGSPTNSSQKSKQKLKSPRKA